MFSSTIHTLQDLSVKGLKNFLEEKSVPLVTEMNKDPASHSFLLKFFNTVATKVLLLNSNEFVHNCADFNVLFQSVTAVTNLT